MSRQLTFEPPETPPYLVSPPAVIPIDTGRQLFVDDFLIAETTLRRSFHRAVPYPANPIVTPDRPWEKHARGASAEVFSDGVWYDPADGMYKMWYKTPAATLYAQSKDGVRWDKPELDVVPGTNIVHADTRDSATVWLDQDETDRSRRFKLIYTRGHMKPMALYYSADGIHWGREVARSRPVADRSTVFWNPFRKVWVFSLREHTAGAINPNRRKVPGEHARYRVYHEHADLAQGLQWKAEDLLPWAGADRRDAPRMELNHRPELYNLDAVAYESLLLGFFSIWHGQPPDRPKPNELKLAFSRDGFHWDRPSREAFVPVSEDPKAWNWGNVQSAGGGCLVAGDRLLFYVSGKAGRPEAEIASTGLMTLRRDGFASMDAGEAAGTLTTRPLRFSGKYLFVNADAAAGELRVEVLDAGGRAAAPFTPANSIPLRVDGTLERVRWKGAPDLGALAGKPVRFRFHLRHSRIYSFWVSPDLSGASYGYVAAGGPGFAGSLDTAGSAAYARCCAKDIAH